MTTSQLAARIGAQRPRVLVEPPERASSAGAEAVELAAAAGLVLDDWQAWTLDGSLAERADGRWSAFEVALWVARQNGKGSILEARELAGLVLFGEQLLIHSAHEFKTASEHFRRMRVLIETCDDLRRKVLKVYTANGQESIHLRSGARLLFAARSGSSGRGFTGDCIVLDEAFALTRAAMGAMLPTLSAVENPQVWYTSSAAQPQSEVMAALNERAQSNDPGRLWLADWGHEPGVDPNDREAWYAANPGLGIRIDEEFIEVERAAMGTLGDEWVRERLGVHAEPDASSGVFGAGKWAACADPDSTIVGTASLALDASPELEWATICGAGRRADGMIHVAVVDRRPGTGWLVDAVAEVATAEGAGVCVDPRSPASAVIPDLVDAGVDVIELPAGDMPRACALIKREVTEGTLRHLDDPRLNDAVVGAAVRTAGDSWVFGRVSSKVDISPLVAASLACWQVAQPATAEAPVFAY